MTKKAPVQMSCVTRLLRNVRTRSVNESLFSLNRLVRFANLTERFWTDWLKVQSTNPMIRSIWPLMVTNLLAVRKSYLWNWSTSIEFRKFTVKNITITSYELGRKPALISIKQHLSQSTGHVDVTALNYILTSLSKEFSIKYFHCIFTLHLCPVAFLT